MAELAIPAFVIARIFDAQRLGTSIKKRIETYREGPAKFKDLSDSVDRLTENIEDVKKIIGVETPLASENNPGNALSTPENSPGTVLSVPENCLTKVIEKVKKIIGGDKPASEIIPDNASSTPEINPDVVSTAPENIADEVSAAPETAHDKVSKVIDRTFRDVCTILEDVESAIAKSLSTSFSARVSGTWSSMWSFLCQFARANELSDEMIALKSKIDKGTDRLLQLVTMLDNAMRMDEQNDRMDEQHATVISTLEPIVENRTTSEAHPADTFEQKFRVPRPSGFEELDFSCSDTPEGELKSYLLPESGTSESVTTALGGGVGLHGMGGVGKTSALIGLGYDEDIRNHFFDGVHFLRLGQKAKSSTVITGLARFVKSSGGRKCWKEVQSQGTVRDAAAEAADWFANRTCLFLIDDLWPSDERPQGFLPDIRSLLNTSATSKIAISTRVRAIVGDSSQQVLFKPRLPQGDTSRRIFLRHAGLSMPELGEVNGESWSLSLEILTFFGGFPIGLAAAGRLLREYLRETSEGLPQALRILMTQLKDTRLQIVDASVPEYTSFYATITASLKFLETERLRTAPSDESERITTSQLFGALCVMKNQARVPLFVLKRLWDVSYDEALSTVEKLADLSLLEKHIDDRAGTSRFLDVSISAHDLVIAYAKKLARHSRNEGMWHKKILDSYKCTSPDVVDSLENSEENSSVPFLATPRPWWNLVSDGYIHENLALHLAHGGSVAELGGLVTDMRWTTFRLKQGGLLELENDIDTFLKALQDDSGLLREESLSNGIQRIRKALRLSWASIYKNPRECGFQLYGRLCSYRETSTVIAEYLKSIELWNEKPWLRPWRNQRAAEDEWLVTEIRNSGGDAAVWTPDEKGIIFGSGKEIVMFDLIRNEEAFRLPGHGEEVTSLSCTDGTRLISGSRDGTLRIWDLETRAEVREPVRGHSGRVNGVAISLDGKIVISGSRDKTVRLWQFERNDLIELSCETYEDTVDTVVISGDGRRAASSSGNVITVWDTMSMERSCTLRGHIRNILGLTMCHDGRQLVSGSKDRTVRVWDLDNKEELGPPLFNYSASVYGVTLSRNGHRLATYFRDGTARVFDMPSRRQIGTPFRHTYTGFPTAALNGDGGRLILATSENICVWDVSDEAELEDGGFGNSSQIYKMAYCQETKTIATVSMHDLYFWDADTGRQLGEPLSSRNGMPLRAVISGDGNSIAVLYSTRKIVIWDVHTRGEIGKCVTRGSWVSYMGISRDGKYIATKSRETLSPRFWDVSASPMATIPAIQVPPHSCQTAISSMENVPNVIHCEGGRISIDIPSAEVLLVNPESDRVVLGSLGEGMRYACWIVHRGLNGAQVIVVGDASGGVNWYTLEME